MESQLYIACTGAVLDTQRTLSNPHDIPVRQIRLLLSCFRGGNGGTGRQITCPGCPAGKWWSWDRTQAGRLQSGPWGRTVPQTALSMWFHVKTPSRPGQKLGSPCQALSPATVPASSPSWTVAPRLWLLSPPSPPSLCPTHQQVMSSSPLSHPGTHTFPFVSD